ncbi:MAG: DUF6069 family protein [Candidatus Nanopelagicales bacterium]
MTTPWSGSVTPVGPPASAVPTLRDLIYAGVVTGSWSSLLSLIVYGFARLIGVPFEVAVPGSSDLQQVPWFVMLVVPLAAALIGALLASLALGRTHAQRLVFWIGTAIAVASLASPLIQPASVEWSSRLWLVIPHAITWFLVVPQIARIAGDSQPGNFVLQPTGEASSS